MINLILIILLGLGWGGEQFIVWAQDDKDDLEVLNISEMEEEDDLQTIKNDLGDEVRFLEDDLEEKFLSDEKKEDSGKKVIPPKIKDDSKKLEITLKKSEVINENLSKNSKEEDFFDTGEEEKKLLDLSKKVENKIPTEEWNEITSSAKTDRYEISSGEYLWKISKKLFGTGFYYSKIWSLNPYITNPHEVTPGMVLVFDTGDSSSMPEVTIGKFVEDDKKDKSKESFDLSQYGDDAEPDWVRERKKLISSGTFVQFATSENYKDLDKASEQSQVKEYKRYEPPESKINLKVPSELYDESGFDRSSKISFNIKQGYYLNTFVSTNILRDFGEIDSSQVDADFISKFGTVFIKFNPEVKVTPGDKFSVYSMAGKVRYKDSDRDGYKYIIVGEIKAVRKVSQLWECQVTESSTIIQRKDRITAHTPRIEKILKTYNPRAIEGVVVGGFDHTQRTYSFGDIVYLDRGRADGVELGNVFEVYSNRDRSQGKKISNDPVFKIGEITVVSLTDNFSTGLVSNSSDEIDLGRVAYSKTLERAALASKIKNKEALKDVMKIEQKALDELDVELHLDDMSEELLQKADSIQLSEDELEELEKQEREKSIIQRGEKDLKELERLENEIESAERQLNEAKIDEDKILEKEDLEFIESKTNVKKEENFEALEEIEKNNGKKYIEGEVDTKENPYGLTETDLEEIDNLLNKVK